MTTAKEQLELIFTELSVRVDAINKERREEGGRHISKSEVKLLGQMSLLANEKVSVLLSLAKSVRSRSLLSTACLQYC